MLHLESRTLKISDLSSSCCVKSLDKVSKIPSSKAIISRSTVPLK